MHKPSQYQKSDHADECAQRHLSNLTLDTHVTLRVVSGRQGRTETERGWNPLRNPGPSADPPGKGSRNLNSPPAGSTHVRPPPPRPHGGQPYRRTSFSIHNRPHQEEEEAQTTGPAREKGSGQDHRQQATDKASPQQNARGDSGRRRDKPGGPPGVRTGQEQEPRAHGVQPAPCPGTASEGQGGQQMSGLQQACHTGPDQM